MNFWGRIYDLRSKGLIPREWKRAHLRRHLERPQGPFQQTTITTVPSNFSLRKDGRAVGDSVRKGHSPRAWRVGVGVFQLIVDPDDDKETHNAELARARHLAESSPRRKPSSVKIGSLDPVRRSSTPEKVPHDKSGWDCTEERMVVALDRLKKVEPALGRYDYLQHSLRVCNVAISPEYQKTFKGYYQMKQRPRTWYDLLFSILEREKRNGAISFRTVLKEVFDETKRLEASFCSKLIATIDANLPVWDRHVLNNLGLKGPPTNRDSAYRLRHCVEVYSRINTRSSNVILQDGFREWRRRFDDAFPRFRHFTDIKKLDLFLWQSR